MNVLYQSPRYKPEIITDRYLYIDHKTGKAVVNETVKTEDTNLTYRSYELPKEDYPKFSAAIAEARKIAHRFPYEVELKEDPDAPPELRY